VGPNGVIGPYGVGISDENGCVTETGFSTGGVPEGEIGGSPELGPVRVGFETDAAPFSSFSFFGAAFTYGFGTIAASDVAMMAEDR
jgi:hypothetical protein